ncbi:aldo/keto reductase [Streptomyces albidoflavus]|uniref:aldo/keto reductase n=1 Tax=Streptomyces albidoflavus TaxID=1886 RepID=UPI0021B0ABAA|nr:aldo/keto reductase [Streptomyces albidoflavus]
MSAGRASAHCSPTTGGLAGLYDTAPLYGAGLAEIRLGELLSRQPRDTYVLSTKVGRVVLDEVEDPAARELGEKGGLFAHDRPNRMVDDYSADATLRSVEDSLKRLGTDRLDIVWVHDIAQDFHGDHWLHHFETARTGAFRVLSKLRDEGVIGAWGLGVNKAEPIELTLELDESRPDGFLLAGRYTLLDHDRALQRLLPASPEIVERVRLIRETAERHGVGVKAAVLQLFLAHPASAAVIPGATRPSRIAEDVAALHEEVPAAFWGDLRASGLVSAAAPLPA